MRVLELDRALKFVVLHDQVLACHLGWRLIVDESAESKKQQFYRYPFDYLPLNHHLEWQRESPSLERVWRFQNQVRQLPQEWLGVNLTL